MPSGDSAADLYANAFDIARQTDNYGSGFRKFRRENSSYPRDELTKVWDRVFDRAQRVRYMEDTNPGQFLSKTRLGCPEGGNVLFYSFLVSFNDENGNQHEQYYHVHVFMEKRIGDTNQEAMNEMIIQLRDRYFTGGALSDVKHQISGVQMRQVKCMTGGD